MEKRNNWFNNYHDIPQAGIKKGKRSLKDRLQYYNVDDFKYATVVDLGCNMGQMSFQSVDWGAKSVIGVEYDATAVENAKKIQTQIEGYDNLHFVVDDLDSNFFWNSIPTMDVVLFLSVIDTIELENRYGILSKACSKTGKVMYFEGHGKQPRSKYLKNIIDYTDFSKVEYLGLTPTNRPFFRCTRDTLSVEESIDHILSSPYKKIAVVGKSLAGKTSLKDKILNRETGDRNIVDDLVLWKDVDTANKITIEDVKELDNVVWMDYKALEYADDFDAVYFITPNEMQIGQNRPKKLPMRSPTIKNFENIKAVYTIKSY